MVVSEIVANALSNGQPVKSTIFRAPDELVYSGLDTFFRSEKSTVVARCTGAITVDATDKGTLREKLDRGRALLSGLADEESGGQ